MRFCASPRSADGRSGEEALKIHFGETEARGIYGEASTRIGVPFMPMPVFPDDRN